MHLLYMHLLKFNNKVQLYSSLEVPSTARTAQSQLASTVQRSWHSRELATSCTKLMCKLFRKFWQVLNFKKKLLFLNYNIIAPTPVGCSTANLQDSSCHGLEQVCSNVWHWLCHSHCIWLRLRNFRYTSQRPAQFIVKNLFHSLVRVQQYLTLFVQCSSATQW